jgi:hypothetical protein
MKQDLKVLAEHIEKNADNVLLQKMIEIFKKII